MFTSEVVVITGSYAARPNQSRNLPGPHPPIASARRSGSTSWAAVLPRPSNGLSPVVNRRRPREPVALSYDRPAVNCSTCVP